MKQHDFILLNRLDDFMNTFLTDLLRALLFEKCGTEVKYHNAHFLSIATTQIMPSTENQILDLRVPSFGLGLHGVRVGEVAGVVLGVPLLGRDHLGGVVVDAHEIVGALDHRLLFVGELRQAGLGQALSDA